MTDQDDGTEELRQSNLNWFSVQFPAIHQKLQAYDPMSELVDEGEGWFNLNFSDHLLYQPSAKEYTESQLKGFRKSPFRVLMAPMQPMYFDRFAGNFLHKFIERIQADGCEISTFVPSTKSYYLIVMGFGLGAHLEELIEMTQCQALVIIEPNLEFIAQSLDVFDWQKLHDVISERGGYLNLIATDNNDEIFLRVKSDIRMTNPCSFDGATIFTNYDNQAFRNLTERLHKDVYLILAGLGFYFDETVMIANTHANLCTGDAQMIRFAKEKIRAYPAFIVASGPSLDKDIEWIKANQDKAIIFACGSAIMPLMRNGIAPDFTVEIENIPELYPMMLDTIKYVDVSKVHLLATTTIDPRVPKFFDKTSYYFRPALSSYPIFARPEDEPMENGSPTVTNAAVALAQQFGFREMYFFGVDMGSKIQGLAHSKHGWQNSDEGCEVDIKFDLPVRGNLGGTVYTYADMNWTRDELEGAIKHFHRGRFYYNCSDGAYIKGTTAKHSRSIKLKDQPKKKTVEINQIVGSFASYSEDAFKARWTDEDMRKHFDEYCSSLLRCFENMESISSKRALTEANKILVAYKKTGLELGLAMIYRGTVWQALMAAEYYLNRVDGEDEHAAAEKIFKEEIERLIRHLWKLSIEDLGHLTENEWAPRDRVVQFDLEQWD